MQADTWVEQCVEDVGKDVDEDEEDADEEDCTHDDGEVVFFEGVDDDDAHSLPVEDVFDEDGAGEERRQPATGGGDDGVEGVAQSVMDDYAGAADAFGACGADVVLRECFEHGVFGELGEGGQGADAECQCRQDKVFQVDVFATAVVVDRIEVAEHVEVSPVGQHVGEEPGDEDGGEEGWEGHAEGGEEECEAVDPCIFFQGGNGTEEDTQHQSECDGHDGEQGGLRKGRADNFAHLALALVGTAQVRRFEHERGVPDFEERGAGAVFFGREEEEAGGVAVVVQGERSKVVEVVEVLDAERFVAAEVAVDDGDAFLVGALAEHHAGGVAREDVEEEEDERDHSQQHQKSVQKPFSNIAQHGFYRNP